MSDPFNIKEKLNTVTQEEIDNLLAGKDFLDPGTDHFEYNPLEELETRKDD